MASSEPENTTDVSHEVEYTSDEELTSPGTDTLLKNVTQTTLDSIIKRIPLRTRYNLGLPHSLNYRTEKGISSFNIGFNSKHPNVDVAPAGLKSQEDVNLAIIPVGAIIVFIIVCTVYIGRWCVGKTPTASPPTGKQYVSGEHVRITSSEDLHQLEVNGNEEQHVDSCNTSWAENLRGLGGKDSEGKLRRHRSLNSVPGKNSRRQLIGLTKCSSVDEERMVLARVASARRVKHGTLSTSSIPLTETSNLSSGSSLAREDIVVDRTCPENIRNVLQNRFVTGTSDGVHSGGEVPARRRTRHYSSPAAATVSRTRSNGGSERASESVESGEGQSASGSDSCCSETRPMLIHNRTVSDVKNKTTNRQFMTSSDWNDCLINGATITTMSNDTLK